MQVEALLDRCTVAAVKIAKGVAKKAAKTAWQNFMSQSV